MKHNIYHNIKEEEYIYSLDNGLELIVIPKKGFINYYCGLQVGFGSKYKTFEINGNRYNIPQGVAHFIEHRLFIKENNHDVTIDFASCELECNAYTDFNSTVYYFNGTNYEFNKDNFYKGLDILLDFVQEPYFDKEGIESEKDIIIQELMMYLDSPDNQLNYGILKNLYSKHPIREDTIGTVDEIKLITKDLLYECYKLFYHPQNMKLVIVGDVDPLLIYEKVLSNQKEKTFGSFNDIKLVLEEDNIKNNNFDLINLDVKKIPNIHMDIFSSKYAFGIKPYYYKDNTCNNDFIKKSLLYTIKVFNIFSPINNLYQKLLDDKLINSPISFSSYFDNITGYILLFANTNDPLKLNKIVCDELFTTSKINNQRFEIIKKKIYGEKITELNNVASLFFSYLDSLSVNFNFYKYFEIIDSLEINDLTNDKYIDFHNCCVSSFIIYPFK